MINKIFTFLIISASLIYNTAFAQTTAMDFNKRDCNGQSHHLFADLDSGKLAVLFYFMPSCGSCPPPAKKIQTLTNNLLKRYPGKIKAYAMPFNNTTKCTDVSDWVSSNYLNMYIPLDSGANQVAHYGGFGMPTVVLVGGKDHRVMFSSLSFSSSDTSEMKDSMIAYLSGKSSGIENLPNVISSLNMFPNPTANVLNISLVVKSSTTLSIDIVDIKGKQLLLLLDEKVLSGAISRQFNTSTLPNGNYFIRMRANGVMSNRKLVIIH
jgi:hypothetical protein